MEHNSNELRRFVSALTPDATPALRPDARQAGQSLETGKAGPPRWLSYTEIIVANFLWGSLYPVGKPVLAVIPPQHVSLARALVAFVVLGALVLMRGRWRDLVAELRYRPLNSATMGIVSFFVNSMLSMTALQYLPASVIGLLVNTSPLWLALGAIAIYRPRDSAKLLAGAAVAFAGVGLVVFRYEGLGGVLAAGSLSALGVGLALLNSGTIALSTIWSRRVLKGRDPVVVTCLACGWSAIPLAAMVAAGGGLAPILSAPGSALGGLAFLGIGCTALNFALFNHALQSVPAERASTFQYLSPLIGAVLAFLMLGEPLTWSIAAGGVMIVVGIALTQERQRRTRAST